MKKRIVRFLVCCIMVVSTIPTLSVFASDNLTPYQIDAILKDVEPVEISPGVHLRDNGEVSIFDIDVSQFEGVEVPKNPNDGEFDLQKYTLSRGWDLSTPYYASFKAKFRVFSSEEFTGYDEIYAQFFDVACPSGSTWKSAIYIGWNEIAASDWLSSSTKTYTSRFYNLTTSSKYKIAFVKTDNNDEATGNVKIYK